MDPEELNGVMKYEYDRVKECGILDFGFVVKLVKDNDYTHWKMVMKAPEDSDYKGAQYLIDVEFLNNYPFINPKFTFETPMYHCNVKESGELNVNWLMQGMKIDYIMPRLLTLFYLQDPSVDKDSERCKLYEQNREEFMANVKKNVEEASKEIKL